MLHAPLRRTASLTVFLLCLGCNNSLSALNCEALTEVDPLGCTLPQFDDVGTCRRSECDAFDLAQLTLLNDCQRALCDVDEDPEADPETRQVVVDNCEAVLATVRPSCLDDVNQPDPIGDRETSARE